MLLVIVVVVVALQVILVLRASLVLSVLPVPLEVRVFKVRRDFQALLELLGLADHRGQLAWRDNRELLGLLEIEVSFM